MSPVRAMSSAEAAERRQREKIAEALAEARIALRRSERRLKAIQVVRP